MVLGNGGETDAVTLTWQQFRSIWSEMSEDERECVRAKARWEHMTLWAVLMDWPDLIPTRLPMHPVLKGWLP